MNWLKLHRRSAVVCALTLLLPLWLYVSVLSTAVSLKREYSSEIRALEPRVARWLGALEVQDQLRTAAESGQQLFVRQVFPPDVDRATIRAGLQSDIRQVIADAGLDITNSQVLPLREGEVFDHIGIKLTVTGDMDSLDEALAALANVTPVVLVESLDVWPNRSRRGTPGKQEVTAALRVMSLRPVQ